MSKIYLKGYRVKFEYSQYIFFVMIGWFLYVYLYGRFLSSFFKWVKDHWFYSRSFSHKISSLFYLAGLLLLSLALLDLRGPEKIITGSTTEQKTVILIDSSASMLVEDVRPNRFSKAILLAKHYIKRAVGQKISIVVFSDGSKRLVPFTEDINLLEARLDRLKNIDLARGGTSLTLAIKESLQYFVNSSAEMSGNILIFTDAEETDGGIDITIPKTVNIGVVGIGTAKGGPVPLRDANGVARGNKKFNGQVVISKLDDKFLKGLGAKIDNYKYWVATSYSLPTDEILNFFNNIHEQKNRESSFRVKPVLANFLMIPGVIFLIISFILGRRKTFVLLVLLMSMSLISFANDINNHEEKTKSEITLRLENEFIKGNMSQAGKEALASSLLKDKFSNEAAELFDEINEKEVNEKNKLSKFNQATALLQAGRIRDGVVEFNKLIDHIEKNPSQDNEELLKTAKSNIAKLFQHSQGGSSGKSDEEQNDKNKDKQQGGKGKSSTEQNDKDSEDKNEEEKDEQHNNNKKDKGKDENDNDREKDNQKGKPESDAQKDERKKKLPALLKQLINDDNQLQKQMIDAKTTKRKNYDSKDW